jgi:hypothetical protein|tara:strand:+ start:591 stop:722 length:132 start_codon:yes stop_codon:yes gene_type:complete
MIKFEVRSEEINIKFLKKNGNIPYLKWKYSIFLNHGNILVRKA